MDQAIARADRRGAVSEGASLSPRELEVAQLVTEGKSNREIAADLYLSEKTVETHMSHILAKLDIRSREHVAGKLSAGGTPQDA